MVHYQLTAMDALIQMIADRSGALVAAGPAAIALAIVAAAFGYLAARWRYEKLKEITERELSQTREQLNSKVPTDRDRLEGRARKNLPKRVFEVQQALEFYEAVAPFYDARNSKELLHTHAKTIIEIDSQIRSRSGALVLDLGGGTGRDIAHHFLHKATVTWLYVDASHAMADQ